MKKLKEFKIELSIFSLLIAIIINTIKIWEDFKNPKINNLEAFISSYMFTLILTIISLVIFIAMNINYVRKKIVWIKYKFGRLDINYIFKITIKSKSLLNLKQKLEETFDSTTYFESSGVTILENKANKYKGNYNSLGSLLEIKYSSQNNDWDEEVKKYEINVTGKIAIDSLDKNIEFFKDFLDNSEIEKISLTFLEENTELLFSNQMEFYDVKGIKNIQKDLVVTTKTSAQIHIHSNSRKAYLQADKKIDFFHAYNDFKYVAIN